MAALVVDASAAARVRVMRVPDGGIQPRVQTDGRGRVHLIYFKGDPRHGDEFYVRSDDGGVTFSHPIRINSQPGSVIAIGTVRGAHLALGRGDRVHVAWMGSDVAEPKVDGKQAPMLYTRLNDAGTAFERQRNVIRRYAGLDGGGAVAADGQGNVYVAWHAPRSRPNEADRRVWIACSRDDGKTFAPEHSAIEADTGACGCCGMDIATGPEGHVFILFRSATQMVHRGTHLLESSDAGNTFRIVETDPWKIGMCVMSTPAFAPVKDGMLAAWETKNQVRISEIGPHSSAPSIFSVPGNPANRKHPALAASSGGQFVVAWAEGTGWNKGGSVGWQVFDAAVHPEPGVCGRAPSLPAWDAPAAFAAADGTFTIVY